MSVSSRLPPFNYVVDKFGGYYVPVPGDVNDPNLSPGAYSTCQDAVNAAITAVDGGTGQSGTVYVKARCGSPGSPTYAVNVCVIQEKSNGNLIFLHGTIEGMGGGSSDGKVFTTSNDTTRDVLNTKLLVGASLSKTTNNPGGNESLTLDVGTIGASKADGTIEKTANKNAANGYAPLDANARVPVGNLGSGTPTGAKALLGDGSWGTPSGSGYSVIQINGVPLAAETKINFQTGVTGADDPGNSRSNLNIGAGVLTSYTEATKPSANTNPNLQIRVTDGAIGSQLQWSDGTNWIGNG